MKKILFLFVAATLSLGAMAQGKSNGRGHGKGHDKHDKGYSKNDRDRDDDEDRYDNRNNNGTWNNNNNNNDGNWNRNDRNGKYSKNVPAKVRDAFYRDYPNAGNVTWTKDRGVWTAHFNRGIFNSSTAVSYRANGQRVDGSYASQTTQQTTQRRIPRIFQPNK
jgi:Ni/Co efflux regulator RcnB